MSDTRRLAEAVEFALDILERAHDKRLSGPDLVAALLRVVATIYVKTAAGDPARYAVLVDDAITAFRSFPGAPASAIDPGRLLSDDELEAAEQVVRAAIRWTDHGEGPTVSTVMSSFDLILADLRRLRAPKA